MCLLGFQPVFDHIISFTGQQYFRVTTLDVQVSDGIYLTFVNEDFRKW